MASSDGLHYIELCKNPIRFDPVSKATNVFYDDANQQVAVCLILLNLHVSPLSPCKCCKNSDSVVNWKSLIFANFWVRLGNWNEQDERAIIFLVI